LEGGFALICLNAKKSGDALSSTAAKRSYFSKLRLTVSAAAIAATTETTAIASATVAAAIPATATTEAATVTTAIAATATAAAATKATATAAACWTIFLRTGFVDSEGAAAYFTALEQLDRFLSVFAGSHGDEGETTRAARKFVHRKENLHYSASFAKGGCEFVLRRVERKISDE
jgi:hypothetical protein